MKRMVQWITMGVCLAAPARADELIAASSPPAMCIAEEARQSLSACPAGLTQISPKGERPQGVKLGQPAPALKENRPGPVDPSMQSNVDFRRRHGKEKSLLLLTSEIGQLEDLWKATSPRAADRVTLARRLAETYVELETMAFRDKVEAEIKKDQPAADRAKKTMEGARAGAIKYYRVIASEYRTYAQIDEVLYYLAYEHEQAQNADEARKVYLQLISDAPQSRYIPNAYLAFGELFFAEAASDRAKYELAKQSYLKVLEYKESETRVWGYAQYKLGYVYWNLGERDNLARALDSFKKVIEHGDRHITEVGAAALQKSARKDIVPVYALIAKPADAFAFFKPLVRGDSAATFEMMDNLGQNYLDTGHYSEAIALYEDLLARDKGDQSCTYQARVVQATMALKGGSSKAAVRARIDELVKRARAFKGESHAEEAKVSCANATVEVLYETGAAWQIEAQGSGGVRGTGDKATIKQASELYSVITESYTKEDFVKFEFPRIVKEDWPSLFKIKYARADLLYSQGDWAGCGPAFDAVVEEDPTGPDAAEAAYAAVLCYQKLYDQTHSGDRARRGTGHLPGHETAASRDNPRASLSDLAQKDMSASQKGMVQAFNRYLCYVKPGEGDTRAKEQYAEVKYARARIYFEAHSWEEAAEGFKDIAFDGSDRDMGLFAAQLYLESLNILASRHEAPRAACFDEMVEATPKLMARYCEGDQATKNEEQCQLFTRVQCDLQRVRADKISSLAREGPPNALHLHEEAANLYLGLWKKYGEGPLEAGQKARCERIDEILYNAAESFQSARLVMKGIQVRLLLLNPKYGMDKGELARRSTYKIGRNYQAIAVYDEAARWYEKYSREFPKADKANLTLSDAVVLRLGLGQDTEALGDADDFMKTYGQSKPVETSRVAFAIGAHHVEREEWDRARQRLSGAMGLIDRSAPIDVKILAHALLGRTLLRLKNATGAASEYRKVRALWKDPKAASDQLLGDPEDGRRRLGKTLTAVGESSFYFAEKERTKVEAIRFPAYTGETSKAAVLRFIKTKVADWVNRKRPAIEAAEREYLKVVQLEPEPPPRWVIAAGSRVGVLWAEFVREFRSAPIPVDYRVDDELRYVYINALDEASEPYKQRAKLAFETCLGYSVRYQLFDEHSRVCEEWLSKTYKYEYHQVDEFRDAPARLNNVLRDRPYPLGIDGQPVNPNPPAEPEPPPDRAVDTRKTVKGRVGPLPSDPTRPARKPAPKR